MLDEQGPSSSAYTAQPTVEEHASSSNNSSRAAASKKESKSSASRAPKTHSTAAKRYSKRSTFEI